jgi:hypothetical protein
MATVFVDDSFRIGSIVQVSKLGNSLNGKNGRVISTLDPEHVRVRMLHDHTEVCIPKCYLFVLNDASHSWDVKYSMGRDSFQRRIYIVHPPIMYGTGDPTSTPAPSATTAKPTEKSKGLDPELYKTYTIKLKQTD